MWALSYRSLTVCNGNDCSSYYVDTSGLNFLSICMALDSQNRLWISSHNNWLSVLNIEKILPAPLLELLTGFRFMMNYLLLIAVYLLIISLLDSNRKHIPPKVTIRYALGKMWLAWIGITLVVAYIILSRFTLDWLERHLIATLVTFFLVISLFPTIRVLSLGVESELTKKTFALTILLSIVLFGIFMMMLLELF